MCPRLWSWIIYCLAVLIAVYSSHSVASERAEGALCTTDFIKDCLIKLSSIKGHDVSHDPDSRNWCQKDLPPCAKPGLTRLTRTKSTTRPEPPSSASTKPSTVYVFGGVSQFFCEPTLWTILFPVNTIGTGRTSAGSIVWVHCERLCAKQCADQVWPDDRCF